MTTEDLYPAADRIARLVRRYGWTVEDVRQESWIVLERLRTVPNWNALPSDADQRRYAEKSLARWCLRKAGGHVYDSLDRFGFIDMLPMTDQHDTIAQVELNDLIASAPADIQDYLGLRCIEQKTWEETRAALGVCNATLARLRMAAADWLLSQYEGGR